MPLWGQDPAPAPHSADTTHRDNSDHAIEVRIRGRFARSKINEDGFRVRVEDGADILEGTTDVSQHKGTATRLAKLAGATAVDNRIVVSEEGRRRATRHRRTQPRRVHVRRSDAR